LAFETTTFVTVFPLEVLVRWFRLERENDMLARQLLTSKITMRADLDKLEDLKESLEKVPVT
jgi:hypothetical protein